jgi:hypothetical protein
LLKAMVAEPALLALGPRVRHALTAVGEHRLHAGRLTAAKTRAIVVANDHSPRPRALLLAAIAAGVRTIYIQHAAVGGFESPIIADRSLLQGVDSADKYLAQGRRTGACELYLVGLLKAAEIRRERAAVSPRRIGVCPGLNDDIDGVAARMSELSRRVDPDDGGLVLRPHPRDERFGRWRAACRPRAIAFSDSRTEPTAAFLADVGFLFSGDSNIALEAIAAGCPAYLLEASGEYADQYGAIAAGLFQPPPAEGPERLRVEAGALARYAQPTVLSDDGVLDVCAELCESSDVSELVRLYFEPAATGPAGSVWALRAPSEVTRP